MCVNMYTQSNNALLTREKYMQTIQGTITQLVTNSTLFTLPSVRADNIEPDQHGASLLYTYTAKIPMQIPQHEMHSQMVDGVLVPTYAKGNLISVTMCIHTNIDNTNTDSGVAWEPNYTLVWDSGDHTGEECYETQYTITY